MKLIVIEHSLLRNPYNGVLTSSTPEVGEHHSIGVKSGQVVTFGSLSNSEANGYRLLDTYLASLSDSRKKLKQASARKTTDQGERIKAAQFEIDAKIAQIKQLLKSAHTQLEKETGELGLFFLDIRL